MAGRKKKLQIEEVCEALEQAHGMVTGAAEILGVAYNTIARYISASDKAREIIEHWRIRRTDRAEYKLDEAIERGESWAVQLSLRDHKGGRERGYGNSLDLTSGGKVISWKQLIELDEDPDAKTSGE